MTVSNEDLRRAQQTGANGGTVNTTGMSWQDRNAIDNAVNKGKYGS